MIVMKFGGSSVAGAERIRSVAELVKAQLPRKPVLVLSAMGDTTDHLLAAGRDALEEGRVSIDTIEGLHLTTIQALGLEGPGEEEIKPLLEELRNLLVGISLIKELTGRTRDYLVSFGERLSVRIAAAYFNARGIPARALDSWDAGFISDSQFTAAEILEEAWTAIPQALVPLTEAGVVPVVTGFIARDSAGNITTLGRGGSDLSATVIAAACGAEEAQVWKDVDGILTADPRLVEGALPVETITYDEAAELAYFGAQVLHPRAMQPCSKTGTAVLVKNSYNPAAPGTRIVAKIGDAGARIGDAGARIGDAGARISGAGARIGGAAAAKAGPPVRAITSRKNVTLVDIISTRMVGQSGFLAEVFNAFARRRISVDMVATSEVSVSLTLDADYELADLKKELTRIADITIKTGKAIVTIVGDVRRSSQILARIFRTCELLGTPVQMVSQGASKVNISFIVDDTEAGDVVKALHDDFFGPLLSPGKGAAQGGDA
ncbi:MAG: aspartate kinase [Spirochaetaceae bacterium]|jgi:aspartate kinase|nr:aspartate kinase [Spirochaetaceae bacterium]